MNEYMFYLSKAVSYTPRYRETSKKLKIKAKSLDAAYKRVVDENKGWKINMFWLIWN
jgi:hypothetical protein